MSMVDRPCDVNKPAMQNNDGIAGCWCPAKLLCSLDGDLLQKPNTAITVLHIVPINLKIAICYFRANSISLVVLLPVFDLLQHASLFVMSALLAQVCSLTGC